MVSFIFRVTRALAADVLRIQIARELLGESGTALRIADEGAQEARRGAQQINAVVVVKTVVFGGDQAVDDMGRDLIQPDPLAVHRLKSREAPAIGGNQHAGLVDFGFA